MAIGTWGVGVPGALAIWKQGESAPAVDAGEVALPYTPEDGKPLPPMKVSADGKKLLSVSAAALPALASLKSKPDLLTAVDAQAAAARLPLLTIVGGQADAYREKMADIAALNTLGGTAALILTALKAVSDADQKARYPFLYAEMKAAGYASLVAARDAITNAAAASRGARAEIERIRRKAKIDIRAATTLADANAVAAAVTWPA